LSLLGCLGMWPAGASLYTGLSKLELPKKGGSLVG
jgi:hypothetical protein